MATATAQQTAAVRWVECLLVAYALIIIHVKIANILCVADSVGLITLLMHVNNGLK